jgi:hypothetical protein
MPFLLLGMLIEGFDSGEGGLLASCLCELAHFVGHFCLLVFSWGPGLPCIYWGTGSSTQSRSQ